MERGVKEVPGRRCRGSEGTVLEGVSTASLLVSTTMRRSTGNARKDRVQT